MLIAGENDLINLFMLLSCLSLTGGQRGDLTVLHNYNTEKTGHPDGLPVMLVRAL